MRSQMLWAWLVLAPLAAAVADDVVIRRQTGPSHLLLEVQLPGIVIGHAVLREEAGRAILLLVRLNDDHREKEDEANNDDIVRPPCEEDAQAAASQLLYRIDPHSEGSIERLRDDIPRDVLGLDAGDLDGDGYDELLFLTDQQTLREGNAGLVPLTGADTKVLGEVALDGSDPVFVSVDLGRLRVFGAENGELKIRGEAELPIDTVRLQGSWFLSSFRPLFFQHRDDGTLVFLSNPVHHGKTRLQTQRIEVPLQGEAESIDCWSRLPQAEEILQQHFLSVDGKPHLLVMTRPSNKLNIFGEKSLRLFSLEADRSRLGRPPVFATESHMNHWQVGFPRMQDVNRDGVDDLVIGYWKGLKKSRVVLDVYMRQLDGSFADTPRSTTLDFKNADQSLLLYGRDLNGDSLPDLLLRSEERLLVFSGRPTTNGKNLLEKQPVEIPWSVPPTDEGVLVEVSGRGIRTLDLKPPGGLPELIDLDGDGRPEIFAVYRGSGDTTGRVRIVYLDASP